MQNNDSLKLYVGNMLKRRRTEIGLTGNQLAKKLNISQQQVSRYEIGVPPITLDKLYNYLINLDMVSTDVERFILKINDFYFDDNTGYYFNDGK